MKASLTAALLALATLSPAAPPPPATRPTTCSYVGLLTVDAPPALEAQNNLPPGLGVVVQAVDEASPAAKAGLAVHDIVTRMDDQLVINPPQFSVLVRLHRPGQTVNLEVLRHGKTLTLPVQLAERVLTAADEVSGLRLPPDGSAHVSNMVVFDDGNHVIKITAHDEDRHVRIADNTGTLVYEGPLNTVEDHDKLPPEVRDKVASIERNWARIQALRGGTP